MLSKTYINQQLGKWENNPNYPSVKGEVLDFYDQLADDYHALEYQGPETVVNHVKPFVENKPGLTVLDVGAGTGQVAIELRKFLREPGSIDALEPCAAMIQKAPPGTYSTVYDQYVEGLNSTTLPSGHYDLVCAVGVFVPGHIPLIGLYEFCRVAKTGGLIAVGIRDKFIRDGGAYKDWFPTINKLEADGHLKLIQSAENIEGFFQNYSGSIFIFEKLEGF